MKNLILIFAFISVSTFAFSGEIAEKLRKSAEKISSVSMKVLQTKTMSLLDEPVRGEALIVADSKGRVRWQVLSPYESILIFDGKNVFQFEKTGEKWKSLNIPFSEKTGELVGQIRKLVLGDFSGALFDMKEVGGKILLTPKSSDLAKFILKIEVTPKENFKHPLLIEIFDADGDKNSIEIVKFSENPKNLEDAFDVSNFLKYK